MATSGDARLVVQAALQRAAHDADERAADAAARALAASAGQAPARVVGLRACTHTRLILASQKPGFIRSLSHASATCHARGFWDALAAPVCTTS